MTHKTYDDRAAEVVVFGIRLLLLAAALLSAPVTAVAEQAIGQTISLTRIYRGDDGSALYLRAVNNHIYGFGEHPGKKYAYVLSGTMDGNHLSARFWDIPKGTRRGTGEVELQVSQGGDRLERKSGSPTIGAATWQEIMPGSFPWPVMQAAGFQQTKTSLDGAFVGGDGSRHYVREVAGDIVWVAEAAAQPDE